LQALQLYLARQNHLVVRWVIVVLIATLSVFRVIQLDSGIGFDPQSYDQLIKRRIWGPAVDPQIVIVDIDERSLDKMRGEFGRWPWPRETLAGALEWLNQKGAQVVVFDILFADPDTLNPASDLAFVEAIQKSSNSYFPILRLNPSNDKLSQVTADQLPGFTSPTDPSNSHAPPTLAVVAPAFDALVQTQRLGYHNIYADEDGVNRSYRLWEEKEGWRLWSLPARLAKDLGWTLPDQPRQLIHYTSEKAAYTQISFSEVWSLSQSMKGLEKDPRFENAIVIIGSTATSLFDVKVTPIDTTHPGVMILANVIDNLKNQSFLKTAPAWLQLLVAWIGLAIVVWASTKIREDQMKWAAPVAPTVFLGIGFASLHSGSNVYWDLAQSASNALLFFTFWAIYLNWRTRFFAQSTLDESSTQWGCSAVVKVDFSHTHMQSVIDTLTQGKHALSVARIGVVNQLPHKGLGLIHIALGDDSQLLRELIQKMPSAAPDPFVNICHFAPLNCDQFWDRIWSDIQMAEQHWRSPHENHPIASTQYLG